MVLKFSTVAYFNLKFYWSICKKMLWLDDLLPSALVQVIAQSVIANLLKKLYNNLNFLNTNIICRLVSNTNIKTVKLCIINLKSKTSTCFVAQNQMDYLLKKRRNWKSWVVRDHMHVCYLHHLIYCMPHWPARKKLHCYFQYRFKHFIEFQPEHITKKSKFPIIATIRDKISSSFIKIGHTMFNQTTKL